MFKPRSASSTKLLQVEGLFTGLPPFSMQSVPHAVFIAWSTREKRPRLSEKQLPVWPVLRTGETVTVQEILTGVTRWLSLGLVQHATTRQFQVSSRSYQVLWSRINTQGRFCTRALGLVLFHSLKQTNSMEMSNISTANKHKAKTKKIVHRVSDLKNHYQLSEIGIWLIWLEYETH